MFCAGFEMNYGLLDVIIRKKQSVSAYAKESKKCRKSENTYTGFKELIYEG